MHLELLHSHFYIWQDLLYNAGMGRFLEEEDVTSKDVVALGGKMANSPPLTNLDAG